MEEGIVTGVKTVVTSVAVALAVYQLLLIAVVYGKLRPRFLAPPPAAGTHRASGDTIVVLLVLTAIACVAVYGFDDDMVLHAVAGAALIGVLALKVAVVRRGLGLGRYLPVLGTAVFALLAVTWGTSAAGVLE